MTILREATNYKHRQIEKLPIISSMMAGTVTKEQYVSYLFELSKIYTVLELYAKNLGLFDDLEGIERALRLHEDLVELDPSYSRPLMPSTCGYLEYITNLFKQGDKNGMLLAHVYVRHMGDLYGGKLMARVVPGAGRCYEFSDRPKIIKMLSEKLTPDLADEANKVFDFYIDIFSELSN